MTLGLTQAMAIAQQESHHFADSRIIVGDWTFAPIYSGDTSQSFEVVGLFTFVDEFTRTGENLSAVWYQLEDGGWEAYSWHTVDLQEAIKSVVFTLGIDNALWEFAGDTPFVGTPESPKTFVDGVIVSDPLASTLSSAINPEPIVDFLIDLGYAAADVPILGDQGCNKEAVFNDLALQFGEFIVSGDDVVSSQPDDLCALNPRPQGPDPVQTMPKPVPVPPWSTIPQRGPLPGTGWIPGGWPITGVPPVNDWYCFATVGGGSCFCSREQVWGRWEKKGNWFPRDVWRQVTERQSCNSVGGGPCPAGGPPPAGAGCSSTFY